MSRYPQTILGTCCVPWRADGTPNEEIFRDGIRLLLKYGMQHLYIFGTAGEGYAVSESQFDEITRIFCQEMQHSEAEPMVGLITLSLSTLIERIERARVLGVREFQISLPSWGALSDKELYVFFAEVCDRFPDCRFLHYNLLRTKRLVTPAEYSILADKHSNLVATKNSTSDTVMIVELMTKAPKLRHFFTEPGFAYGSFYGDCGLLVSIASLNPQRAQEYFEAGANRNLGKLMTLQREIMALREELLKTVAPHAHMDGAYDKIFARVLDPRFPLDLQPPYQGVDEATFESFLISARENFPQWLNAPAHDTTAG